jgi:hypothetical protein
MTKMTKLFLTISVACFGLGFTGPGSEFLDGGLKPIAAVAFIAFFISNLLAKEMALYDQESSKPLESAKQSREHGQERYGVTVHA